MSIGVSEASLSDIAAVTNRNDGYGNDMFGGNGAFWLIVLLLFGWGRNGFGGFGGGYGNGNGCGAPMQAQEATQPMPMQSYSAQPEEQAETYIQTNGDSEFLNAVDGRKSDKVWKLIDELVEAVKILHPRMYTTFIDKVQDL